MLPSAGQTLPPFWDVNGDGWLTPNDVLMVINYLNALPPVPPAGEGEAVPAAWSHTRVLARPSLGSDGQSTGGIAPRAFGIGMGRLGPFEAQLALRMPARRHVCGADC